jgi:hypothetical protein
MMEQPVLDLPASHVPALAALLQRVPPQEYRWVLIGSGGLRLQGVDVPVHDLDLQTDEATLRRIESLLADCITTPVHLWESPGMRSLDGKARLEGIEIELLANIAHRLPDGSWSSVTDFSRLRWLDWHGLRVAVFPLEDELAAYEAMGRTAKADLIRRYLDASK